MKLCYDPINISSCEYFTESKASDGTPIHRIKGPFLQGDIKNHNRRVYPFEKVLAPAVKDYTEQYINTKRSLGELEHPESPEITLERACIIVEKFEKEGTNYIGTARVLHEDMPCGKILAGLLKSGVQIGVSSRGVGALEEASVARKMYGEGVNVVSKYKLVAEDVIYDPSGPDCYVDGIVESKDYVLSGDGMIVEANLRAYDILENALSNLNMKDKQKLEEARMQKVSAFIKSIRNGVL